MGLSTHVLDTAAGRPAAGVRIGLFRLEPGGRTAVAEATTNADGRTDAPLLPDGAGEPGLYEIVFEVGAYFAARGEAGFYDVVPVRFRLGAGHHHVPLLVSPFGYTTYRGS